MPDFKGRKDFPEVADEKIKIGDYSGTNRLAVTDIYSPKAEPELRDRMMEPVKGKTNNYDSPILSQQPVIVLSDMEAEAALIDAINGYVSKQGDSFIDVEEKFGDPSQKSPREPHPSRAHDEGVSPRQRKKPRRNPEAIDMQKQGDSFIDVEEKFGAPSQKVPREPHPSRAHDEGTAPRQRRKPRRNTQAIDTQKSDFEKKDPVPQGALKPAGGGAGGFDAAPEKPAGGGGFQGDPGAWRKPAGGGASQATPPKPPTGAGDLPGRPDGTGGAKRLTPATPKYSAYTNPGGAAGAPKTTPGGGGGGEGLLGRLGRGVKRGAKAVGRGIGEQIGAAGQAAKVGVQQGIRHGVEGAYEHGPEADARRAEQAGKVYRNPLTATVASGARRLSRLGGVKQVARGMGYGRTAEGEREFAGRHEYSNADDLTKEVMLSDILNELESYVVNEQPDNSMAEQQLTKGNFSKMMRNTDAKTPRDWKYHV